ncbi:acyl carrier protein [Kitasatospora sp. NBC_01287]|uniref:acyl carrier protein n=1 Tax=Kitasatospora sp. NBC_01287 TaxID=2903573 RepID=UPI002256C337|nr:acyl carrier protein [Kitasatospora sp. NBC_01287]MCX4744819.1 acyl carrier protein [Kitasatospora sp. NBC_01287]
MSDLPPPDRAEVVAILATFGDRDPSMVDESVGSLELTWLISEVEQRYAVLLDLADAELDRMHTVTGAIEVLHDALADRSGDA